MNAVRNGGGLRSDRAPILVALMLSIFVVAMDTTILSTAVDSIVDDLGGFEFIPWLFSIYLLAQTVTVSSYGKLADMFGRKPMLLIGIGIFLVGSVLCGFAWDMTSLTVFRGIQGLGGGAIVPISITIAGDIYTVAERSVAQGYLASVWAVAAVLGPTFGGVFAQFVNWRWIFFINIPICLIAGYLLLRNFEEKVERRKHTIDYLGASLLTVALSLLILGVLQGGISWEWLSIPSVLLFGISVLLFVAFVFVERRAAEPVLPFSVIRRPIVLTTSLTGAVMGVLLIGITSFVPTFLQGSLGVSPIAAGLAVATILIGWAITSALAGKVYLRWGFRVATMLGAATALVSTVYLAIVSVQPNFFLIGLGCFLAGLGGGITAAPSTIAAQASVAWHERGVVTGLTSFLRAFASTVGIAVLGSIINLTVVAHGGDETDPTAISAAATAVFIALSVVMVFGVVTTALMPKNNLHLAAGKAPDVPPALQ